MALKVLCFLFLVGCVASEDAIFGVREPGDVELDKLVGYREWNGWIDFSITVTFAYPNLGKVRKLSIIFP